MPAKIVNDDLEFLRTTGESAGPTTSGPFPDHGSEPRRAAAVKVVIKIDPVDKRLRHGPSLRDEKGLGPIPRVKGLEIIAPGRPRTLLGPCSSSSMASSTMASTSSPMSSPNSLPMRFIHRAMLAGSFSSRSAQLAGIGQGFQPAFLGTHPGDAGDEAGHLFALASLAAGAETDREYSAPESWRPSRNLAAIFIDGHERPCLP